MSLSRSLPPLNTMVAFESVARLGSFTAAAKELHLTQSAVSKQIQTLEARLRIPLFKRHARGIHLTEPGEALLETLEPALVRLASGVNRVRQRHDQSTLNIVATHAVAHYWLFPRVTAFNQLYPQVTVNIHSNNALQNVRIEDHDFVVLYGCGDWPHLNADPLFDERVYPIALPGVIQTQPNNVAELACLPLIQLDTREWDCIDWPCWFTYFGQAYTPPNDALTFNQVTLVYQAVKKGLGVGLGWAFMVSDALERGELEVVGELAFDTGKADFLVHLKNKPLKPTAELFRSWLCEHIIQEASY